MLLWLSFSDPNQFRSHRTMSFCILVVAVEGTVSDVVNDGDMLYRGAMLHNTSCSIYASRK